MSYPFWAGVTLCRPAIRGCYGSIVLGTSCVTIVSAIWLMLDIQRTQPLSISSWIAWSLVLASTAAMLIAWAWARWPLAADIPAGKIAAANQWVCGHPQLQAILDFCPVLINVKDREGRFVLANRAFNERFAPAGRSSVIGLTPEEVFSLETAVAHRRHLATVLATGAPTVEEHAVPDHNESRTYLAAMFPLRHELGSVEAVCSFATDITEQKQVEVLLREHADLLDQASDAILGLDLNDHVTFWNSSARRLFGWSAEEVLGRSVEEILVNAPAGMSVRMRQALLAGSPWRGELKYSNFAGGTRDLELRAALLRDRRGEPRGCILTCTDVTERKLLNEQLLRAQRLESIGMLATGIAHDLNNILAPIGMATALLRNRVSETGDIRLLDTLATCAQRGADLIRQVLGFTHGISGGPRIVQVKHLLRDVVLIMNETFPKSIAIESSIPNDLLAVNCNPTQIHQVVMNLCVNARDAMPAGGVLTLSAQNREIEADAAQRIEGASAGTWIELAVSDTGTGIPADVLPRIWEPFFTTKGLDKGTGLGLPTVRGIVASHNGCLTVDTKEGEGTTFRVYLPAAERPSRDAAVVPAAAAHAGAGQRMLVVDDEPSIRETASRILQAAGYVVDTAENGATAAKVLEARRGDFEAVILDSRMPIMDGDELAGMIRRHFPQTRILRISGIAKSSETTARSPMDAELTKPFTAEALLSAIDLLLHPAAVRS